jgi:dihydroorotate dehydrogenase
MMMMDLAVAGLRLLPPETAHSLTVELASAFAPLVPRAKPDDPRLNLTALGLSFANPIGMAAGFDKNATAFPAMFRLGFGHVETGTVTPRPQSGNPKPRMFRLPEDGAIVNRMGFNNRGMEAAAAHLMRNKGGGVLGVNIGANRASADRVEDYRIAYERLARLADYVAINISSPNTPGLRNLQAREELHRLLHTLTEACSVTKKPLLLKIAPDLDEAALDDIAAEVLEAGIEGLIVSNTTLARQELKSPFAAEAGGLSGRPLLAPSTALLKSMRARVGNKLVLVGVGGVSSGADAYAKIRAGATLVQVYTALVFKGIGLLDRIKRELLTLLERDGFASVAAAIGADVK